MNKINRSLVKTQAQQMVKNKVLYLFIISFIVSMLVSGASNSVGRVFSVVFDFGSLGSSFSDYLYDYDDPFEDFGAYDDDYYNYYDYENPIDGFEFDSNVTNTGLSKLSANPFQFGRYFAKSMFGVMSITSLVVLALSPLYVTLEGVYISFVRRNVNQKFDLAAELSGVFKRSFDKSYLNKLVGYLLVGLITMLLACLFIVPGVIFSFSAYFTFQLMNDYPNLKPSEAIKLSRKIVAGNRTELFTYELSFIPWYLLIMVTFGLANIYVLPYKSTCDALYYENFRLRALAEGRIVEDDFLSADERFAKYNSVNNENPYQAQPNGYYAQAGMPNMDAQSRQEQIYKATEQYVANNCTFFTPDFRPIDPFAQYNPYANPYGNPYQQYQQPNGGYYNPPQQQRPPYQQGTAAPQQPQYTPYYTQPPVEQEVQNTNSAYTQPEQHSYAESSPVQPQEVKPEENVSVQNDMSAEPSDNVSESPQMPETPSADYPSAEHTEPQENAPSYCEPPQSADSFSEKDNNEQY
ncbi:MAG: DUF975 family protein [Eubacterium sp.]|nr:DUF975 family protein [Eubacterium sp.]